MIQLSHVSILKALSGNYDKLQFAVAGCLALFLPSVACGTTSVFVNRPAFESKLSNIVVDDYERLGYRSADLVNVPGSHHIHSDISMSAVFDETKYNTTGFTNWNIIVVDASGNNRFYCAGCNGSYLLDFTATSVGTANGVFGVGLDVVGGANVFGTHAYVTYGDGSMQDFVVPDDGFWGITSDLRVKTMHFGLAGGVTNTSNDIQRMAMDNLTIGAAIPEPASGMLAGSLVAATAIAIRRRGLSRTPA